MSHSSQERHGTSGGDDLGSTDEVKVFKDEGDREDDEISSENLLEEKSSLIDLTESEAKNSRSVQSPVFSKIEPHLTNFNMGYLVPPYTYASGTPAGLGMVNKIGLPPFFCHSSNHLTTPPPAHCGIAPLQIDPKIMGLQRPALYTFPSSQYPYPIISPEISQVASWHTPSVYSSTTPSFRGSPYSSVSTTLPGDFPFRFTPSLLPTVHTSTHHILNPQPAVIPTNNNKQDCISNDNQHQQGLTRNLDNTKNSVNAHRNDDMKDNSSGKKKTHIKKPLNAFMLYMKEMRAKVVAECTLKESAAINQILGRRWHSLCREEQAKYYELARRERQLHMELYPGWSARDNYGFVSKKKKRKKDRSPADISGNNMKKCRARFGLDQQNAWCKPCRRKKKCVLYMEAAADGSSTPKDKYSKKLSETQSEDSEEIDDVLRKDINKKDSKTLSDGSSSDSDVEDYNKSSADDNESVSHSHTGRGGDLSNLTATHNPLLGNIMFNALQQQHSTINALNSVQQNQNCQNIQQQHQQHQQIKSENIETSHSLTSLSIIGTSTTHATKTGLSTLPHCSDNNAIITSTYSTSLLPDRVVHSLFTQDQTILLGKCMNNIATAGINSQQHVKPNMNYPIISKSKAESSCTKNQNHNQAMEIYNNKNMNVSNQFPAAAITSITAPTTTTTTITTSATVATATTVASLAATIGRYTPSCMSFQRNPIGANPRDINNPLSINQLTKRPQILGELQKNENNNLTNVESITANTLGRGQYPLTSNYQIQPPPPPLPPTLPTAPLIQQHHHQLFGVNTINTDFTNQFQQELEQKLATVSSAAVQAAAVITSQNDTPLPHPTHSQQQQQQHEYQHNISTTDTSTTKKENGD